MFWRAIAPLDPPYNYNSTFSRIIRRSSSVVFIEQNFGPHMLQ